MINLPRIGTRQGKVWGTTQLVFRLNGVEAHHIEVKKGGYCSRHYHRGKWNRFVVTRGCLVVRIVSEGALDETALTEGMVTDVPPEVLHEFEAETDCEAFEFYWTELDPEDIVRETMGGMRQ